MMTMRRICGEHYTHMWGYTVGRCLRCDRPLPPNEGENSMSSKAAYRARNRHLDNPKVVGDIDGWGEDGDPWG